MNSLDAQRHRRILPGDHDLLWFIAALSLGAIFLFICNLNLHSALGQLPVATVKKYGMMVGLVVAFAYLIPCLVRRKLTPSAPKVWLYLLLLIPPLLVLFGVPQLKSFGMEYAQMTTDYWSADYDDFRYVLLKRSVVVALFHLLGGTADTYLYYWLAVFLATLWLTLRWLVEKGLSYVECLSLVTSSALAYALLVPGYVDLFIITLVLYTMQKPTSFLEKTVILILAMGTHEIAAAFFFLTAMFCSESKDRREWFLIYPSVAVIDFAVTMLSQHLQGGSRPAETISIHGVSPIQFVMHHHIRTALGIAIAYKLYWLIVLVALKSPAHRLQAGLVLVSLPLILIATDVSRVVQFSTLTLFLLVPLVLKSWSTKARLTLAWANLLIPTFYAGSNMAPIFSDGLYFWIGKIYPLFVTPGN